LLALSFSGLDPSRTSGPINVEPGWVQILTRRRIAKC